MKRKKTNQIDHDTFCESTHGHASSSANNTPDNSRYENIVEQRNACQEEVLSLKQVAHYLQLSESKIRRMVNQKLIPYAKLGGQYRFYLPKIRLWLEELTQTASEIPMQSAVDIASNIWQETIGE